MLAMMLKMRCDFNILLFFFPNIWLLLLLFFFNSMATMQQVYKEKFLMLQIKFGKFYTTKKTIDFFFKEYSVGTKC